MAAEKTIETLKGRIERVTFANEENGFAVVSVKIPGKKNLIKGVGLLGRPVAGEFIEMTGAFNQHPKHGLNFEITESRLSPPSAVSSLKKYLGSGLIKGLGPVLAGRLVDYFGDRTLDILDQHPERLTEVSGLGAFRRERIINSWQQTAGLKRLLTFLARFGLGPSVASRITRRLGPDADELIKADPYRLAYEVEGVGFATADKVAHTVGLAPDAPERLRAGLLYTLNESAKKGHVFLPDNVLLKEAAALLPEVAPEALTGSLGLLILNGQVKTEPAFEPGGPTAVYSPRLHRAENWVAEDLLRIMHTPPRLSVPSPEKALVWAENKLGMTLAPQQREAALAAFSSKVLLITGGPGTGKTTITQIISVVYEAVKGRVGLAAPTGRAAKRLSQATGRPAQTVHRLLEYAPHAGGFARGPKNKLELDLLLVDEASMLDIQLMDQISGALPAEAVLILVGDQDQLPSVGPGRVLADLIASGTFPVARLTEIYRQASNSQIITAAHQINQGIFPESSTDREHGDFYFLAEENPARIMDKIIYLATKKLPGKLSISPMEDIQIITPMHGGDLGTEKLNEALSRALNPLGHPSISRFGRHFKTGDKVMQLKNNYDREVFNGDSGRVASIDLEGQELVVDFEGRGVAYDFNELDELALSYAITVHKAQGSEFPAVIIPMVKAHQIMLRRNLLYTAVTRGRRFVVLVGSREAVQRAVFSNKERDRYSRLAFKISGGL